MMSMRRTDVVWPNSRINLAHASVNVSLDDWRISVACGPSHARMAMLSLDGKVYLKNKLSIINDISRA